MNLTFDLQLFDDVPSLSGGFSGSGKDYEIGNVVLSGTNSGSKEFANFKADSSDATGFSGAWADKADTTSVIAFGGSDVKKPDSVGLYDSGNYNWTFSSTQITSVTLGAKTKINLSKVKSTGLKTTLEAAGGQQITFGEGVIKVNVDTVYATANNTTTGDQTIASAIALKGGASEVNLLTGSALEKSTIVGESNGVVSLFSAVDGSNTFNLKGSKSEAFVTIGGASAKSTVHSSNVEGFTKITFDAKAAEKGAEISLSGIKDSEVNILGSTTVTGADSSDKIIIGKDLKRSTVSITGGDGIDAITLSETGAELIVMNSLTSAKSGDTVVGWASNDGNKTGNTLKIEGLMSTFYVNTVKGAQAVVAQGSETNATTNEVATTLNSSLVDAGTNYGFGVNIKASDDTYSALLVGSEAMTSVQGVKFDKYNYVIADTSKTLDLGTANKTTVVLANTVDEKHWGDTNVYQNVVNVKSSKKGGSLIINGKEESSMTAKLNGSNDSIWGANNLVGDAITLTKEKNQVVFSGANDGLDTVSGYVYGTSASKANAVRFLDGIGYVAAGKKALDFGADENNGVHVVLSGVNAGDKVAYGFGTEGDKYLAMVDATEGANGKITYGSDVNVYIGQGDSSYISVDSAAKDVKLGWDGGAGYVSIGGVIGTLAADGAVIVGTTDNAQTISGSSRGASSISGGFVADKWTDENADVLIGGGIGTKSTTFFVGKDMGKDEIQNLSSKDNIVFLGTKFEELVKFTPEATDTEFSFQFANNNIIDATAGGKKLSAIKDVSLYFDDGTYIWNGSTIEKAAE